MFESAVLEQVRPCEIAGFGYLLHVGTNESIAAAEADLRSLIRLLLIDNATADWLAMSGLTEGRLQTIRERIEAEPKRRPGTVSEVDPTRYLDFYDLGTIIKRNWGKFKDALGPRQSEFFFYFSRLADLRDPDAHNRLLLPFEMELVAGIAGEIRNRVTIFRSTMGPNKEYYPNIETVVDSLGTRFERPNSAHPLFIESGIELRVGDVIKFMCSGWDPNGRELNWALHFDPIPTQPSDTATGTEATLTARIAEWHVKESLNIRIVLTSSGAYHRKGPYDDELWFVYSVAPPS